MYYTKSTGIPYYVGKGCKGRITKHITYAKKGVRYPLADKIRSLWVKGEDVCYSKVADNLSEKAAFDMEMFLISHYGRRTDGGYLLNLTFGGDGASGQTPWNKGGNLPDEVKTKVSNGLKRYYSENASHRLGAVGLTKWKNPKSDLGAWKNADLFYRYWKLGSEERNLHSVFESVSKMTFATIVKCFEKGWMPVEDPEWIEFSKDAPKLKESPFRIFKGIKYPEVYEIVLDLQIMFNEGLCMKSMAKKYGRPVGAYTAIVNMLKAGWEPKTDKRVIFATQRNKENAP